MSQSIGIIETKGIIGSLEAADVALKSSYVELVTQEFADGGLVTIILQGDVGAVTSAVEAAVDSVKRLGIPVTGHVIPRPSDDLLDNFIDSPEQVSQENCPLVDSEESREEEPLEEVDKKKIAVTFNGKSYSVFQKNGIDRLKVVHLRQLARNLSIDSMDKKTIKFANKEELVKAIREHYEGGIKDANIG